MGIFPLILHDVWQRYRQGRHMILNALATKKVKKMRISQESFRSFRKQNFFWRDGRSLSLRQIFVGRRTSMNYVTNSAYKSNKIYS